MSIPDAFNEEHLISLSSQSHQILRTPSSGSVPVDQSQPFIPMDGSSPAATRSATVTSTFKYVDQMGSTPVTTNISGFIVLLPASITSFEGPVFGIVGEPVTVSSKRRSQRLGVYVRELFKKNIGDVAFMVEKDELEFVTKARHFADMDNILYRFGRVIDADMGDIINVQVVALDYDRLGVPRGILVCPRGSSGQEHWLQSNPWQFKASSKLEYFLDFGSGELKNRLANITRWGIAMTKRVGSVQDITSLLGTTKAHPKISIEFAIEVQHLDSDGESQAISAEDFLNTEIFGNAHPDPVQVPIPTVKAAAKRVTRKKDAPKTKAAAPVVPAAVARMNVAPIEKTLFPLGSESEDDQDDLDYDPTATGGDPPDGSSSDGEESDDDLVDGFKIVPPPVSRTAFKRAHESKYGVRMTEYQLERHNAIFKPTLYRGKWPTLSIEARADRVLRDEGKRGVYEATKTAVQSFLQGNMGSDPIAYYMPFDKVPLSEKQSLPMEKWTVTVEPRQWVLTMKDLDGCFYVMNEMAGIYLRSDVANAVTVVYKKVNYWQDTDFPIQAVNAYRDLYCGALAAIVDAAVDGDSGFALSQAARDECSPNSEVYITTITNRQNRVDNGRSWCLQGNHTNGNNNGKSSGNQARNDGSSDTNKGGDKGKGLTEAQKALVPTINGRSICLANLSVRGCKRGDGCTYLHDSTKDVPPSLASYFKKRFGPKK